jgi:hypothetical protein
MNASSIAEKAYVVGPISRAASLVTTTSVASATKPVTKTTAGPSHGGYAGGGVAAAAVRRKADPAPDSAADPDPTPDAAAVRADSHHAPAATVRLTSVPAHVVARVPKAGSSQKPEASTPIVPPTALAA